MTPISFYVQIVSALDEIGAPYMIVGAFGGYPFGITRVTFDIDLRNHDSGRTWDDGYAEN